MRNGTDDTAAQPDPARLFGLTRESWRLSASIREQAETYSSWLSRAGLDQFYGWMRDEFWRGAQFCCSQLAAELRGIAAEIDLALSDEMTDRQSVAENVAAKLREIASRQ